MAKRACTYWDCDVCWKVVQAAGLVCRAGVSAEEQRGGRGRVKMATTLSTFAVIHEFGFAPPAETVIIS